MMYLGDFIEDAIVYFSFTTNAADGGRESFSATLEEADIVVFKDGSAMTLDASTITITSEPGSRIGVHIVSVDMSNDADFTTGSDYVAVLYASDETLDSQAPAGVLAQWSCENRVVDVAKISGDSTAADNLEAACDGTGYNIGNGSVVAASVTGNVGGNVAGNVVGSVGSVTAGVTVTTNNDKTNYSLTADQSGVTVGTVNALGTSAVNAINAEVDTALADIHLDHLLAADYDPASKPGTSTALLNELIESDGGVSRFTANALEQAPSGGGTVDANITQIEGHALAGTGTQIADAFEHFFNVATPSKTINDCGVAGSGLSAQDVWEYNISAISTAGQAGKIVNDIVADTNELQSDDVPGLIAALNDLSAADVWTYDISGVVTTDQSGEVLNKAYTAANDANSAASANTTAIGLLNDLSQADVRSAVGLSAANLDTVLGLIVADTNELQTDWADGGRLDLILDARASQSSVDTVDGNVDTLITQLTTDVSEPGVPGATATVPEMLATLYGALRNRIDVTSSAKTFYGDAGAPVWSKSLSDDGTTYTEAEGS